MTLTDKLTISGYNNEWELYLDVDEVDEHILNEIEISEEEDKLLALYQLRQQGRDSGEFRIGS